MSTLRIAPWICMALAGCTVESSGKGTAPTAVDAPTEAEVEDYVSNGPIDLDAGSTLGGSAIATEDDLVDPTWEDLTGVPGDLLDGDDDTLATLACAEGEWLSVISGSWTCTDILPPERIDAQAASEADVLTIASGEPRWVALDAVLPAPGCASGMVQTGDTCVESTVRAAQTWHAAVLDCANDAMHLCFHAELMPGCVTERTTAPPSGLEWAADRTGNGQAAMAFDATYDCDATTESIGNTREYRCCTAAR